MKIIFYSPHPTHDIVSETGYSTHQREVINALKNLGHEVMPLILGGTESANLNPIAGTQYKPSLIKRVLKLIVPGILWTTLNNIKLRRHDKMAGMRLEKAIMDFRPELIYERSEYLQDSGTKMALKYKIRHIIEVNAPLVEEMKSFEGPSLLEGKGHRIEEFKYRNAYKVISVSSSLADYLVSRYKCNRDKIFIQPNCINPEKLKTEISLVNSVREKYNLRNSKVIGFVGSMFPYHGVDILIEAFRNLTDTYSDLRLLIVGDGIVLDDLKKMTAEYKLNDNVIFTGRVSHQEVFNYIETMDICIMAKSNWYGSPVKLFEYGLMKKPVIAPDTAPVRDVMVHGSDALIISEDVNELVKSLRTLIENEALADKMALHFHNKVMREYNWSHAAQNIIQLCG